MVSTRHQSAVAVESEMCLCHCPQKETTACIELPSQTTCRFFNLSPSIHPGSSFTSKATLLRGAWTPPGEDCRATRGCWQLRKQGIRRFVQRPRFVASRVRARDNVSRRCFLDDRDSRVGVSDWTAPKRCTDYSSPDISSTAAAD